MMAVCMVASVAATAEEMGIERRQAVDAPALASRVGPARQKSIVVDRHCSFTAKGSVNMPGISFDFACTATEETCKDAIQKALECARLTVKIVKDQFRN